MTQFVVCLFVSMNVIIVIFFVVFDFFVQLNISKKNYLNYKKNSNVQIVYAQKYDRKLFDLQDKTRKTFLNLLKFQIDNFDVSNYFDEFEMLLNLTDINLKIKFAVSYDLSQSDFLIFQQIQYFCSFSNCIWNIFMLLVICNNCNDFTNQIEKQSQYKSKTNTHSQFLNDLIAISFFSMNVYKTNNENKNVFSIFHDILIWSIIMMNVTKINSKI